MVAGQATPAQIDVINSAMELLLSWAGVPSAATAQLLAEGDIGHDSTHTTTALEVPGGAFASTNSVMDSFSDTFFPYIL